MALCRNTSYVVLLSVLNMKAIETSMLPTNILQDVEILERVICPRTIRLLSPGVLSILRVLLSSAYSF